MDRAPPDGAAPRPPWWQNRRGIAGILAAIALGNLAGWFLIPRHSDLRVLHVRDGDSIVNAVSSAKDGATIVVHEGTYGRQTIARRFSRRLTIEAAPGERVVVRGFVFTGPAGNILVRGFKITPDADADGVRFADGAHAITLADLEIVGGNFGVRFAAGDPRGWPMDIDIRDSDISGAHTDTIHVSGARNASFVGNRIHDTETNELHNDGIQVVAAEGTRIVGNEIFFTRPRASGPNQAVILGRADPPTPERTVSRTQVIGNLIHHWPGAGILVAGAADTLIAGNTVYDSGLHGRDASVVISVKRQPALFANPGLRVVNNIFYRILVAPGARRPAVESNNLVRVGGGGSCLLTGDPRFEDERTYGLAPDSPAIGYGRSDVPGLTTPHGVQRTADLGAVPHTEASSSRAARRARCVEGARSRASSRPGP